MKKMFLSRIHLDLNSRNTLRALNSPSVFHGAVESSFIGARKRDLWRIDKLDNRLYLLLLSEDEPDLRSFCQQFGYADKGYEIKSYDGLLSKINAGDVWRFRVTANATRSVSDMGNSKRGKVSACISTESQKKWLIDKSNKNGFSVTADSFEVVQSKWLRFYKKASREISLFSVTYEGLLEVTDAEAFRRALTNGIGRGKAYGMGLLTVISPTVR